MKRFCRLLPSGTLLFILLLSCSRNEFAGLTYTGDLPQYRVHTQDVDFLNGFLTLAGRLYLPEKEGELPALVFVHRSGKVTRDDLDDVARYFARFGFAVLTYDKRGVGDSAGDFSAIGEGSSDLVVMQLSDDASAGADYLMRRDDINFDRIGVIGMSQAGWIIPYVVNLSTMFHYFVIISGPTLSVGRQIYYQDTLKKETDSSRDLSPDDIYEKLKMYDGPSGFNPRPYIEKASKPGLWVMGGMDQFNPSQLNREYIEKVAREQEKDFTVQYYPEADHYIRDVRTRKIVAEYPENIVKWICDRLEIPY